MDQVHGIHYANIQRFSLERNRKILKFPNFQIEFNLAFFQKLVLNSRTYIYVNGI